VCLGLASLYRLVPSYYDVVKTQKTLFLARVIFLIRHITYILNMSPYFNYNWDPHPRKDGAINVPKTIVGGLMSKCAGEIIWKAPKAYPVMKDWVNHGLETSANWVNKKSEYSALWYANRTNMRRTTLYVHKITREALLGQEVVYLSKIIIDRDYDKMEIMNHSRQKLGQAKRYVAPSCTMAQAFGAFLTVSFIANQNGIQINPIEIFE
jgi:hypothetical protein